MKILLEDVYKKTVLFLNEAGFEYIIIGGIAAGTLGEPRVTGDVDVDILLDKGDVTDFLKKAKLAGFTVDKEACVRTARQTGVFQITYGVFHIDFIIASIELEKEAFRRKNVVKLYGVKAFFPSPEDLILLKIIPGRSQDLFDAERIAIRHKGKLNKAYLEKWARKLSDDAEDMRIWNEIRKLLTKT